jgi:Predicted branched-chain amino acid permeases (azaleucine resistance)
MNEPLYLAVAIAVIALVTWLLRAVPFLLLGRRKLSGMVLYLGKMLPPAIMAILVVFCLKNLDFLTPGYALDQLIPIALVIGVQLWRKNTLLSILVGVVSHMAMIRL